DDDRAVGGHDAGDRLLVAEERQEVASGERVEPVVVLDPPDRGVVGERRQLARGLSDLLSELRRAADALPLPERSYARHAGRRRHEDTVTCDLLDSPGRRAQQERLPLARLVD